MHTMVCSGNYRVVDLVAVNKVKMSAWKYSVVQLYGTGED